MTPPDTPEIDEKRRRFESTALPFLRDLSNVARRLAHRDEDARDLVQETWLRAYRTFDNFRPGTNCKAWLLTILYSIFINQYRKARREPEPASLEERHAALQEHLAACESCRREREAISAVRAAAQRALGPRDVPPEVQQAIRRALDREAPAPVPLRPRAGLLVAAGLIAAALAVILILLPRRPNPPAAVENDFEAYRSGKLALALETSDTRTMEAFFASNGIRFRTRVFDLAMMKYRIAGGRVHRLAGRPSALWV